MNLCFDFSRSKKDKTNEKKDISDDKKNTENEVPETNVNDSVGYSLLIYFAFNGFFFQIKKSGYKPTTDHDFHMYLDEIRPHLSKTPLSEQVSTLARYN
jgi:hypothetical protein